MNILSVRTASSPIIAIGLVMAISVGMDIFHRNNHDTSWLITINEKILNGEQLYIDVIDTNPPFSIWLYSLPVWLSKVVGVQSELAVLAWVYMLLVMGLGSAGWMALRANLMSVSGTLSTAPAFFATFTVLTGHDFSQRDHIGGVLFLPFVVLGAWRCDQHTRFPPQWRDTLVAGVLGSVLVLIKPYYAPCYITIWLYTLWHTKSFRAFVLPEYWLVCLISILYIVAVHAFTPAYISDILPLVRELYSGWSEVLFPYLVYWYAHILFGVLFLWLREFKTGSHLDAILMICSNAALIPFHWQGKGFTYHLFVAISLGICANLVLLASRDRFHYVLKPSRLSSLLRHRARWIVACVVVASCAMFAPSYLPSREIVTLIGNQVNRPSVELIGVHLPLGFPLTRIVKGSWKSPYGCDWVPFCADRLEQKYRLLRDPKLQEHYRRIATEYFVQKKARILSQQPDIVVCWLEDPLVIQALERHGIKDVLDNYGLYRTTDGVGVFIREHPRSENIAPSEL